MKLSAYQEAILQAKRNEILDETITVVTVSYTGAQSDFYGAGQTRTETTQTVSGKVGWGSIIEKNPSTGGNVVIGDCSVLISLNDKSKIDGENIYLKDSNSIALEIIRILPAYDTNECVIYCKRR